MYLTGFFLGWSTRMVEKYMERNKKISISQVDILEFFNFYKEIAKYQYLYTLENNLKIFSLWLKIFIFF